MRKLISIIGNSSVPEGDPRLTFAYEMGKALVDNGYRVATGGMGGVMEAAFKGAHASKFYQEGDTVAIVPGFDRRSVNKYADIVIATGLDIFRNVVVANSDAVIAVGGGAGTLAEISSAWTLKRLILAFDGTDDWSGRLAGTRLDSRVRYENIEEDKIFGVSDASEAIAILEKYLNLYDATYKGIPPYNSKTV